MTVYDFQGLPDGNSPTGDLAFANGLLVGTTYGGGTSTTLCPQGCGTVYAVNPSSPSQDIALHLFNGAPDGAIPEAGVIADGNTIYGTTFFGGRSGARCFTGRGCGTVFSVTLSGSAGKENVLYRFRGGPDGSNPAGTLAPLNGTLYGTTEYGGEYNHGTVFTIGGSGKERVIYSFGSRPHDGAYPVANLVALNCDPACSLYGVTSQGGKSNVGTIFVVSPPGTASAKEHVGVVYDFTAKSGDLPVGLTTGVYGNRAYGTASAAGLYNRGSLFSFDPKSGKIDVLHFFKGFNGDGALPYARPVLYNGILYGTTREAGNGTIYADPISGTRKHSECQIYRFGPLPDGQRPVAPLGVWKNTLYGTTIEGGTSGQSVGNGNGFGTLFAISPNAKCV